MKFTSIQKNSAGERPHPPGPWWRPAVRSDWSRTATVCCPSDHVTFLDKHRVDQHGYVDPVFVCPDCGWTAQLILDGWALREP